MSRYSAAPSPRHCGGEHKRSCLVCCIGRPRRKYCLRSFRLEFPRKARGRCYGLEPGQSAFGTCEAGIPDAAAVAWLAWEDRQGGRLAGPPTARPRESLLPEIFAGAATVLHVKSTAECRLVRCGRRPCSTPCHSEWARPRRDRPCPE